MKKKKTIIALLLLAMIPLLLCGCSSKPESAQTGYHSVEEMAGKKIGVVTGTLFDQYAEKYIENVTVEYYNATPDLPQALNSGKIDGYLVDEPIMRSLIAENPTQRPLDTLEPDNYGFVFPKTEKGAALRDQFNEYLAAIRADGTLQELDALWFGSDEAAKVVDLDSLSGENGTLKYAISSSQPPFSYIKDGKLVGYEIDIAAHFCRECGYALEIHDSTFTGVIASISGGKSDFGSSSISITEERMETMYFSEPYYMGGIVIVVRDGDPAGDASSAGGIRESFEKTFVREARWKLFASGIGITVLITVLAVIFGTALGFLLYLVYRKNYGLFNGVLNILMDILEKTPVVVILMILYYILFGKTDLDGVWVSVIGFSVMFACTFVNTVKVGVMAVDKGQTEAALSLGFKDTYGFLSVILPQAAKHFLPNYRGNIVSLLKDTAIVGYIAVQDLTKVGDIIRSRTYEAFFPLIATALIYFLLAWVLTLLVRRIEFRTDPTKRSREKILKGVKTR